MDADVTVGDGKLIEFSAGALCKASAAGRTFFKSTVSAYFTQVWNANLSNNGFANVTGFDWTNLRLGAGLFNCRVAGVNIGIIARTGLFGTQFLNFQSYQCPNPIQVLANSSVLDILHPTLDNETGNGGTGAGTGISIAYSGGSNIGVNIKGGYVQGFGVGIDDAGISTKSDGVYFELCTTADVWAHGSRSSSYTGCVHFGPSGAAAYLVNTAADSTFIGWPDMASGGRTKMLVRDSVGGADTNTVFYAPLSATSMNSPIGDIAGAGQLPIQTTGTFTPVIAGSTAAGAAGAYQVQSAKWSKTGNRAAVELQVQCTGHTGTGSITIIF
jgi:hypothetical protein